MSEENTQKSDTITISKDKLWKYSTFVLLAIIVVGGFMAFSGGPGGTTGNVGNTGGGSGTAALGNHIDPGVTADDHFLQGGPDSKVIIVEYSDFECPFCGRAYTGAVAQIKSTYPGDDVAIAYRNFPLSSIHPQAQKAAEAAECAADQGKFVEMHNMLFERGVSGGVTAFKGYATTLGLNTADFNNCLDSGEKAGDVNSDLQAGQSQGVRGTPGFIVNGQLVSGAQPFAVFDQLIKAAL